MQRDVKIGIAIGVLLIALIAIFWWARDDSPSKDITPVESQVAEGQLPPLEEPGVPVGINPTGLQAGQVSANPAAPAVPSVGPATQPAETAPAAPATTAGTPATFTPPAPVTPAAPQAAAATTYKVQKGDTLYGIAQKFYKDGAKSSVILEANKAKISRPEALMVGTELVIPELAARSTVVPAAISVPAGSQKTHTVAKGETLSTISQKYFGTQAKWKAIYEANTSLLTDPNRLKEGMVITIPAE